MTTEKLGDCSGGSAVRLRTPTTEDVRSAPATSSLAETEVDHHRVLAVVTFRRAR
jgi:hypothetical protein